MEENNFYYYYPNDKLEKKIQRTYQRKGQYQPTNSDYFNFP